MRETSETHNGIGRERETEREREREREREIQRERQVRGEPSETNTNNVRCPHIESTFT